MNLFRSFWYGVKNLIIWFPIIWKDRWWDYYFLFVLLRKKLSIMEKNFRKYGMYLYAEKDADKMKKCLLVLNRLIEDDYDVRASEKNSMKERKYHAEYLKQQDIDYLFDTLRKNILTWWD